MTPGSSSSKKRKPKKHDAAEDDKPAAAAAKKQKRQQHAIAATTTSSTATTTTTTTETENGPASTATAIDSSSSSSYTPLSLSDIQARILLLCDRVPNITDSLQPQNHSIVYEFASSMQSVLEEFWLLCGLINSATYTWGTDRSGASEQNLSLLSNELSNSQEQLNTVVTPRLTNILAPVVDLVTEKVVVVESDSSTTKQHVFKAQVVDEEFVQLCRTVLCRNAMLLRQNVLSHLHKIHTCIQDYLTAESSATNSHDANRFAY